VLSVALKLTKYTGADQIAGHQRFALEYGPFLMAAIGEADSELLLLGTDRPTDLIIRIRPDKENGDHFILNGMEGMQPEVSFIPYFEVANQSFSCFPIIEPWVI
jgi:hypothetical protein